MRYLFTTLSAGVFATAATGQSFPEHTDPVFADKIDRQLSEACPDPTPSLDAANLRQCVDGVSSNAAEIAAYVSDFIRTNPSFGIPQVDIDDQLLLLRCAREVDTTQALEFEGNERAYTEYGIGTAARCVQLIDAAEQKYDAFVNTAAQNHLVDAVNCFVDPDDCERPNNSWLPGRDL